MLDNEAVEEYMSQVRRSASCSDHQAYSDGPNHDNSTGPWEEHHTESYSD